MAARDAKARTRSARIAADVSWAKTANRSERTAHGTRNSPVSYNYWLRKITDEGNVRAEDIPKAAESAHRAYMRQQSLKAAKARAARAAAKKSAA